MLVDFVTFGVQPGWLCPLVPRLHAKINLPSADSSYVFSVRTWEWYQSSDLSFIIMASLEKLKKQKKILKETVKDTVVHHQHFFLLTTEPRKYVILTNCKWMVSVPAERCHTTSPVPQSSAFYSTGQFHTHSTHLDLVRQTRHDKISKHSAPLSNQTPVFLFTVFSSSTTAEWSNSLHSIVNLKEAQAINCQYNLYQHHYLYKHATPTVTHYISTSQWSYKLLTLLQNSQRVSAYFLVSFQSSNLCV